MDQTQPASVLENGKMSDRIVNDFCITFGTVNGSGSATANLVLLKSFSRMGIPVNGKNIFPSNIQGLPTWYSIRLSKKGYLARVEMDDIVVAMNPSSMATEMKFLVPGGVLFYADDIRFEAPRDDVIYYPMPVRRLVKEADPPQNLRDYLANMVYVGVVAQMLGIDMDIIYDVLDAHFKGKKKAIDSNWLIIQAAAKWAKENLTKQDRYHVEPMTLDDEHIVIEGNTASALGALYGGVQFTAWYPITPASSLPEALMEHLPSLRTDPETNKTTSVIIQAEDEIAAIGMTIGAGWAGLRAMTSTSGPGISLMAEYLGLAYYAEVPVVVWDVQRVGPSTGLPTRTAQGDLTAVNFLSHGDTDYVILLPDDAKECFEFGWKSFDIAERLQTPVIILTDLDIGMNYHVSPRFEYPDQRMDRGKVLWEDDLQKMIEKMDGKWGRYLDVDGDGIPFRTLPGNRHPASAYFARGTGHDEMARYSEDPQVWERGLNRLKEKIWNNRHMLPEPEIRTMEGAKIAIIGYGSTDPAIIEARDILVEMGVPTNYMRIRSLPFRDEVFDLLQTHERIYVVELNRDGQLKQLLTIYKPDCGPRVYQVSHVDGMPITARWIVDQICSMEGK
ncbi:MAG: 2-oxoacid:acceptor oxidoreductase subunit alpha [Bellilinea sp.]|jgi:2-oxoglutarate ferredoxin oxidoreductase subunit alpha